MRETRDRLRRRLYRVHQRAELITPLEILNAQNNRPPFGQKLGYAANRAALHIPERFRDPSVRRSATLDLALIDKFDELMVGTLIPRRTPAPQLPTSPLGLAPGTARLFPRSAELFALALRLPARRACDELATLLGASARRFEEPTWGTQDFLGASRSACSRLAVAKGPPTSILFSCLVQPSGCNPVMKKAVQTKGRRSTASEGNDGNEERIFKIPQCAPLTSEAS